MPQSLPTHCSGVPSVPERTGLLFPSTRMPIWRHAAKWNHQAGKDSPCLRAPLSPDHCLATHCYRESQPTPCRQHHLSRRYLVRTAKVRILNLGPIETCPEEVGLIELNAAKVPADEIAMSEVCPVLSGCFACGIQSSPTRLTWILNVCRAGLRRHDVLDRDKPKCSGGIPK